MCMSFFLPQQLARMCETVLEDLMPSGESTNCCISSVYALLGIAVQLAILSLLMPEAVSWD